MAANSSLAQNLLRVTLAFYLSLAFLLTLGQLVLEYRNEKERLGEEIKNVALTFSPIISKALWSVDNEQTLASLHGMLKINHDLTELELFDANEILIHRLKNNEVIPPYLVKSAPLKKLMFDEYRYSYRITYTSEYTKEQAIGLLVLKSNSLVVYHRAAHTFLITILSAIFKTFLLCIIFYFIIRQMIGRPLQKITHAMRNFNIKNDQYFSPDKKLLLRNDELGVMVNAFNAMTQDLIIKDRDLYTYSQSLEEKVKERTYQLEAVSQAKTEFLASMSHEIRTPMNGVLGLVHLLSETPLNKEQRNYIEIIEKSGESLIQIVNDILDNLKIESNNLELEKVEFDLEAVCNECIALFKDNSKKSDIEIVVIYSAGCMPFVIGDPTRVRQVIVNLLGNAFKFTQHGCITLLAEKDMQKKDNIILSVKDTGIGIEKHKLQKLFMPFSQADSSTTRIYGGTGLGLCICKRLVELMGGVIGVTSEINKGSTFWCNIPLPPVCENGAQKRVLDSVPTAAREIHLYFENTQYGKHLENLLLQHHVATVSVLTHAELEKQFSVIESVTAINSLFVIGCRSKTLQPILTSLNKLNQQRARLNVIILGADMSSVVNYENVNNLLTVISFPFSNKQAMDSILDANNAFAINPDDINPAYPDLSSLKVLVAEDNTVNQIVIQGFLKKFNIIPVLAETGLQAVDACIKGLSAFDVILMDGEMPEMDGWTAAKKLRELDVRRPNSLPVIIIALTAHAMESYKEIAVEVGMDAFLNKPLDKAALEEVLLSAFNSL